MTEDTKHLLVALGLGIPIAAVATYVHLRVMRYFRERGPRR